MYFVVRNPIVAVIMQTTILQEIINKGYKKAPDEVISTDVPPTN